MTGSAKKPSRARAIADVSSGTILASVEIAAPPERVFRALSSPEELVRWWGSDEVYRTTQWDADFRVHGRWRAEGRSADGSTFFVEGEFLEIDPPRKLVQTWKPAWDEGHTTTISYLLEPIENGTRVVVRHEGFGTRYDSCRSHGEGWQQVLDWLSKFVNLQPSAATYYLCRLLPPRPSFALDMNGDERAMMQEHALYWRKQMAEGRVVVFGPVGDPQGPWGLGVVRASDAADIQRFADNDPAILSGRGFRCEVIPMITAVLPD
jgi:uncharacterized protein YndB with AHSA1/START domain/uncharacterized protein YciI